MFHKKRKALIFLVGTLCACLFFCLGANAASYGVDVSHWNGTVNFTKAKASGNCQFAYIKATDGYNSRYGYGGTYDNMFKVNAKAATAAGIEWAPYHFLRLYNSSSVVFQAHMFYDTIKGTGYNLRPVCDAEEADGIQSAPEVRRLIKLFCDTFEELSGQRPVIYSYTAYINTYYLEKTFSSYDIIQSDFRGYFGQTKIKPFVWQYTAKGWVDGIGVCDRNICYNLDKWRMFTLSGADNDIDFSPNINSRAGKQFQVLNSDGSKSPGHLVFKGDSLKIIGVSDYSKQILKVEYPVRNYWVTGYISNNESFLHNSGYDDWRNGSTNEVVYDDKGDRIGTIFPRETATILGKANGYTCVLYQTGKGKETKSGFVKFKGLK